MNIAFLLFYGICICRAEGHLLEYKMSLDLRLPIGIFLSFKWDKTQSKLS